jgi:hypothetical protein
VCGVGSVGKWGRVRYGVMRYPYSWGWCVKKRVTHTRVQTAWMARSWISLEGSVSLVTWVVSQ